MILNVYRTYYPDPPGGLQEAIKQICVSTAKIGIKQTIFTLSPKALPTVIETPEAQVVRSRSWLAPASCDIGGLGSLSTFSDLVAQASIVQYHFPWPFADLLHTIVKPKIPAITTYHSDIVRQKVIGGFYKPLMMKTLQSMEAIVATSPAYVENSPILSHYSIRDKVSVIPLGIDESGYDFSENDSIFKRVNFDEERPFFLFLGVLRYYKGLSFLVEAARKVKVAIIIAGSGPEELRLKQQVEALNLQNVFFTGQVSHGEKVSLLKKCLALILPSHLRSEAFGMVLVEASMFGKPMISCEVGTGTSFVNLHEKTGFVVNPESPNALSDAIMDLYSNLDLTYEMGVAARARYEQLFSGPALGSAYANLYNNLL